MKYSLRSLMLVVLVLPPILAGGWWGYQRLFPPFTSLPPALPAISLEELRREWNEKPIGEALFDPDGLPEPMKVRWLPAPNPPKE